MSCIFRWRLIAMCTTEPPSCRTSMYRIALCLGDSQQHCRTDEHSHFVRLVMYTVWQYLNIWRFSRHLYVVVRGHECRGWDSGSGEGYTDGRSESLIYDRLEGRGSFTSGRRSEPGDSLVCCSCPLFRVSNRMEVLFSRGVKYYPPPSGELFCIRGF